MALLVAASPCALARGTPATVLAGIAPAARNGVLIKGGTHLEALGAIEVLALDKTGTITKGEPEVTDVLSSGDTDETTLLATAAAVEHHSQHLLAKAIIRAATGRAISFKNAEGVQSITGRGVRGRVDGVLIEIGHLRLFADAPQQPPQFIQEGVAKLEAAGRTTMVVRAVGESVEWMGVIGLADEPREGVKEVLLELKSLGIRRIVMLTGDNAGVAAAVAHTVGVDSVRAQDGHSYGRTSDCVGCARPAGRRDDGGSAASRSDWARCWVSYMERGDGDMLKAQNRRADHGRAGSDPD